MKKSPKERKDEMLTKMVMREDPITKEMKEIEILHNLTGPANVVLFEGSEKAVKYEGFFVEGKRDSLLKPSTLEYHKDGSVKDEQWYLDDQLHRVDGPAWSEFSESGQLRIERWFNNGLLDRADDAAYIVYDDSGNRIEEVFYTLGVISKPDTKGDTK